MLNIDTHTLSLSQGSQARQDRTVWAKPIPTLLTFSRWGKICNGKNRVGGKFLPSINQIAYSILSGVDRNLVCSNDINRIQYCACVLVLTNFCVTEW